MKKIFKNFVILFIFCLTFTFGGFFNNNYFAEADSQTATDPVYIDSATDLENYVKLYGVLGAGNGTQTDNIILTDNINMSGIVLTKTIGTAALPFKGTFDGNGFKIENLYVQREFEMGENSQPLSSQYAGLFGCLDEGAVVDNLTVSNMKIDARADLSNYSVPLDYQYAGLVGYANGATLQKIAFEGNCELLVGGRTLKDTQIVDVFGANNVFAGTLVGKSQGTKIEMIQNYANVKFNPAFDCNINFGSLAGMLSDSEVEYVNIKNQTSFANWEFSLIDGKTYNIGGLAGAISNSEVCFSAVTETFNLSVKNTFVGQLNLGGVAGSVNQGNTKIYNLAIENTVTPLIDEDVSANAQINLGEVVGKIGVPVPQSGNLSYIYFKNNNLSKFGYAGLYAYLNEEQSDYVKQSSNSLNSLESSASPDYFATKIWHPLYGNWNFDDIWYVGGQSIKLQCFYGTFVVDYNDNSSVVTLTTQDFKTSYHYGDSVKMDFAFKKTNDDLDLSRFFNLSAINKDGIKVATINSFETANGVTYTISDCDYLSIIKTDSGFELVVDKVSRKTAGKYSISTSEKIFKANITSKLFNEDQEELPGIVPGYVYFAEGANTTSTHLPLENMSYQNIYRLRTREIPNSPYLFEKWVLIDEDGEEHDIGESGNKILEINFGSGHFVGNFDIYAKYLDNAQVISFILDEGISKIELNSGTEVIDESGQSSSVSKSNDAFKLDVYIKDGYQFDVQLFVDTLNTYKSVDSSEQFCVQLHNENDDNKYSFALNMTVLNKDDFGENFEIKAQTSQDEKKSNFWIWIVVGVGGGILLIGLIVLIVVLVRRNRFGGMGGASFKSFKKGNYY